MLFDKTYSDVLVIEYLAIYDVVDILKNPIIDNVVTNLFSGSFQINSFMEKSTCFSIVTNNIFTENDENSQIRKHPITLFVAESDADKGRNRSAGFLKRIYRNVCSKRSEVF